MIGPQIPLLLGGRYFSPYDLPGLAAAYDLADLNSVKFDASNRVSFVADKSGNSGVMGLVLNGASGNYASAPDAAPLRITGDVDLRIYAAANAWNTGAAYTLMGKSDAGARLYELNVNSSGKPYLDINGAFDVTATSALATYGFADKVAMWLRVTRVAASGVVTFFSSSDGTNWTQLDQITSTTGAINTSARALYIGEFGGGTQLFTGIIYRAQIYNGIAGALAFDANFTAQARGATSFVESSVNAATVTVNTSGATGARICGARDLYQGTGSAQPLLLPWSGANYGYLPGATGNYFSTPNAAPLQIVADIDLRGYLSLDDWTPGSTTTIISKQSDASHRSYQLEVTTSGTLLLGWSENGTTGKSASSTAAVVASDGARIWVRGVLDVDNGAAGNTATFYTSADGITWTVLGAPVVTGGTTSIFNSSSPVEVGSVRTGAVDVLAGKIYRAQIYNGIGGTLAADFNPSQAAHNATSWASSTGETWTVNQSGAKPAQIVGRTSLLFDGSAYYMKSAAFTLNQPTTIILVGKQIAWTSGRYIFDGNTLNVMSARQVTSTPGFKLNAGADLGLNSDWILGQNAVVESVFNAATSLARVNRLTAVTGSAGSGNAGGLTVGDRGDSAGVFSNFQLAKMFIFASALDTATLDKIAVWAGKQEGIAV